MDGWMDEDGQVTAAQPSGAFHTLPTERTFGILDVMITTCWHAKITTTTTTLPVSENHNHSQSLLLPASLIPWSSSRNATADECQSLPAATTHCSCQVSSHLNQIHLQHIEQIDVGRYQCHIARPLPNAPPPNVPQCVTASAVPVQVEPAF